MNEKQLVKISKRLSLYLRHAPHEIGLTLQPGGWVAVDDLLEGCHRHGFALERSELEEVVAQNSKQRFSFDETGTLIRANQGHSVEIDLQLESQEPPATLWHGTAQHIAPTLEREGILRMKRHHVHLSGDIATARTVGARHGRPVIFEVNAAQMARDGHVFYRSENGIWLVDEVPPKYLRKAVGKHE